MKKKTVRGYKVFNPDFTCRDQKYKEGEEYKIKEKPVICQRGFHFCIKASDCFSYYDFAPDNIVCEVEALGDIHKNDGDSKIATNHIKIVRRLSWQEVLVVANEGSNNTGFGNSGARNSGVRNSGDRNSGDSNSGAWNSGYSNSGDSNSGSWNSGSWNSGARNSGDSNSGYSNSGDSNSGAWNSGAWNSGAWNSGDRNSGDSNSGYRNSGAFCTDRDPEVWLFDKPTKIKVREWEQSKAVEIMCNLDLTIWVPSGIMSKKEKRENPDHETTGGYLKTITLKEAWQNLWGNLTAKDKKVFTDLPNFDADKFEEITGIKT